MVREFGRFLGSMRVTVLASAPDNRTVRCDSQCSTESRGFSNWTTRGDDNSEDNDTMVVSKTSINGLEQRPDRYDDSTKIK
jgi:hypothetical protein